jgi:hypothetical protein
VVGPTVLVLPLEEEVEEPECPPLSKELHDRWLLPEVE